ncbi:MAG: LysE family translocator [Verrucomicrobiales bacterium]|nr:LysE family translocator [Verrucomicrobiales bacterium]
MLENSPIGWTFIGLICMGIITPGPDLLYILSLGLGRGRGAACVGALGICSGLLVHTLLGAAGLLALVVMSKYGLAVLKVAGAVYLIYLGIRALMAKNMFEVRGAEADLPCGKIFRDGFLINILNPKFILFSFAFFPQFVRPQYGEPGWQMLQLGLCNMLFALAIFCVVGTFSSFADKWLYEKPRVMRAVSGLLGVLFILLGLELFYLLFAGAGMVPPPTAR